MSVCQFFDAASLTLEKLRLSASHRLKIVAFESNVAIGTPERTIPASTTPKNCNFPCRPSQAASYDADPTAASFVSRSSEMESATKR
jgi:hypothetical protein